MTEDQLGPLADEFEAKINESAIDENAEVAVLYHWIDGSGRNVKTTRNLSGTNVKVSGFGSGDGAKAVAHAIYIGTVIENVRNSVLSAPCELSRVSGSEVPIRVGRIELEIRVA